MSTEFQYSEHEALYAMAEMLGKTFIQRHDMFASQLEDGRYVAIKEALLPKHLALHLEGHITLGTYMMAPDSTTRLMAFDADGSEGLRELSSLAIVLGLEGIPSYLETSRRGGHMWFFFEHAHGGKEVRRFGKAILERQKLQGVELYPKQDRLYSGPGSCVRLPFGKHKLTGQRYPFILPNGEILAPTIREQIHILSAPQTVPEAAFGVYVSYESDKQEGCISRASGEIYGSDRVERVKKAVPLLGFISDYVELKPVASGGVGRCPFHDDNRPSFGVSREGNFWQCFAGCGGGSIIDFWMKWKGIGFSQAVDELADLLGMK